MIVPISIFAIGSAEFQDLAVYCTPDSILARQLSPLITELPMQMPTIVATHVVVIDDITEIFDRGLYRQLGKPLLAHNALVKKVLEDAREHGTRIPTLNIVLRRRFRCLNKVSHPEFREQVSWHNHC